ncbi:hypothetical protein [Streptomyces rhizosphaerihabitans]|uniref:hypothetical protein n=1 Tax=Streptomyces rhizosphaerihabitans TaxID=1266770 RepID=UPI0021C0B07D|nr:hypothetical protein [Streptomyces rhizosphaerihabitans]MCT9004754.1 hypothetical protein [Streptomyces rhizosphaerihabitans]
MPLGRPHAMTVNETVIAMIRPKPDLALLTMQRAEAQAVAQAAVDAPKEIGALTSYATEVALAVKGTWKNPAIGSARADVVVIAPDDVPLLFIEVDNCTEEVVGHGLRVVAAGSVPEDCRRCAAQDICRAACATPVLQYVCLLTLHHACRPP